MREQLAEARRSGVTWADAWPAALSVALAMPQSRVRSEWQRVLLELRPAWMRAYDRQAPQASEAAIVLLAQTRRPGGVRVVP
jgi:hypothetical protein